MSIPNFSENIEKIPDEINPDYINEEPSRIEEYTFKPKCIPLHKCIYCRNNCINHSMKSFNTIKRTKATFSSNLLENPLVKHSDTSDQFSNLPLVNHNRSNCINNAIEMSLMSSKLENENKNSNIINKYPINFRMSSKNVCRIIGTDELSLSHPKVLKIGYSRTKSEKNVTLISSKKISSKGYLTIEVIDTGCGILDKDKEKLFNPFVQANKEIHGKFGGTGLGLWFSHKLLSAMNGAIECNSVLNQGSNFKITLMVNCKMKENNISCNPVLPLKSLNIICLNKNENEIREKLSDMGCNIVSCNDTKSMIESIRKYKGNNIKNYCTILGSKMAQKLLNEDTRNSIKLDKVIVITSILFNSSIEKLMVSKFPYVLGRPLNKGYLVSMLGYIMKRQVNFEDVCTAKFEIKGLVVDDNKICRTAVVNLLKQYTKEIFECGSGNEAVKRVKEKPYDFAIIDYQMPGLSGIETIKKIREYEKTHCSAKKLSIICKTIINP